MVNDEELRRLNNLAKKYHIIQKFQDDDWPSAHKSTFQAIQDLSQTSFQTYCDSIDSPSESWREQNKGRAQWLVEQAGRLSLNAQNESAWRMCIENAILERFSAEVAWYELGTSKLFEDRVEEQFVYDVYDDPLGELPRQKPDRVVGLRDTKNIRQLLDQPPRFHPDSNVLQIKDLVRSSPFKQQSSPLLFPFLILEAKSDSAPITFSDIQTQTAFPIWSLLNLQKKLQSHKSSDKGRPDPLVWFLGYKGGEWKVYGCYLDLDSELNTTYNIHHLRNGDLTTKDGAIQLILLIDYLVDWARDTFRSSIIGQLTAMATGKAFDDVSQVPDSDVASMRKSVITKWLAGAANATVEDEAAHSFSNETVPPESQNDILSVRLPNTACGAVRPVSTTIFQFAGLRVTEGNVESLIALSDAPARVDEFAPNRSYSVCARKLVNEMTRWDEVLVVIESDLDNMERVWTDQEQVRHKPFDDGQGTEFYVVFEYRCFIDTSWNIIRELSYLAVSKSAFTVLLKRAAFQKKNIRIDQFPTALRDCPAQLIKDAVDCLRSGSAWQVLHSAISSTLLSLYPKPERRRTDCSPLIESLGLGYPPAIRVRHFIEDFMKAAEKSPPRLRRDRAHSDGERKRFKAESDAFEDKTRNQSFRRTSQRATRMSDTPHHAAECVRCRDSKQDLFALKHWDPENIPSPTV